MKKPLCLLLIVVGMIAITTTAVQAQESTAIISFIDEEGYTVDYDLTTLTDIIATSDTLVDDDGWFMEEYESVFPSKRGVNEPAILVLLPVDEYFYAVFIQENKKGKLLSFRAFTRDGWLEVYEGDLRILKSIIH